MQPNYVVKGEVLKSSIDNVYISDIIYTELAISQHSILERYQMGIDLKNFIFAVLMTLVIWLGLLLADYNVGWLGIGGIFLLSYPWKIRGNVFSLWGGFGERDVASLFGIYQDAGRDAFQIFGLSIFQKGGRDATQVCGVSLIQRAIDSSVQGIGVSLFQNSKSTYQVLGFSLSQEATDECYQGIGISVVQESEEMSCQVCGLSIFQMSDKRVKQYFGIALAQRARDAVQVFGIRIFVSPRRRREEEASV